MTRSVAGTTGLVPTDRKNEELDLVLVPVEAPESKEAV